MGLGVVESVGMPGADLSCCDLAPRPPASADLQTDGSSLADVLEEEEEGDWDLPPEVATATGKGSPQAEKEIR